MDSDGYFTDNNEVSVQCIADRTVPQLDNDTVTIQFNQTNFVFTPDTSNTQYILQNGPANRHDVLIPLNQHWTWLLLDDSSFETNITQLEVVCFTVSELPQNATWFCNE